MSIISFGGINKSLLYIILMAISQVLNQYIYGFIYIECFYPMNIYRILYNAIIDPNKKDFPRHRVFDPIFSYIGVIILSFCSSQKNNKDENEDIIEININSKQEKSKSWNISTKISNKFSSITHSIITFNRTNEEF